MQVTTIFTRDRRRVYMATNFNVLMILSITNNWVVLVIQPYFHISMFSICAVSWAAFFRNHLRKLVKKDFKDRIVHCHFQIIQYFLPGQSIHLLISQQIETLFSFGNLDITEQVSKYAKINITRVFQGTGMPPGSADQNVKVWRAKRQLRGDC